MVREDELINQVVAWSGAGARAAFWWLGQASVVLKIKNKVIYIDPYLHPHELRLVPPLLKPAQVTNADLVLCTHDHEDHLDHWALPGIAAASGQAVFVVPAPSRRTVIDLGIDSARVVGLNAEQKHQAGGITITAVKAKHEFFDQSEDGAFPYLGYVIQTDDVSVYHAGDTLVYDGLALRLMECGKLTLMFLPINGRDAARYRMGCLGNMTYQEAVDLAGELRPQLVVPMHYDMFAFNSEDPKKFADYLEVKYPGAHSWVGLPGARVEVQ